MLGKPVILCVDDVPNVLEGRKMLLEENGYRVLTATNGEEAVEAFVSNSVDLVLLDYHMPGMNGDVAASHMKASKADVPVALLSGDECLPPSAFQAVDCVMSKSEPIAGLLEKVDYLLSVHLLFQPLDAVMTQNDAGQHCLAERTTNEWYLLQK